MHEKIAALIKRAAQLDFTPQLSVPEVKEFGDYSTNAAFAIAKKKLMAPLDAAKDLVTAIEAANLGLFRKVEARAPGFVNMHLSDDALRAELGSVLEKGAEYGKGMQKGKRISLDYLDANPTGPAHLGHARGGFFGDVLANILAFSGYEVSREFYVNNARSSLQIRSLGKTALGRGEEYKHGQLLRLLKKQEVAKRLRDMADEGEAGYYVASLIQKENADFLKKKAKITFDIFFEEESVYEKGLVREVLSELTKRGAVYEKDGAVWFKASAYGDTEDRVFVRSDGAPTYVLPDVAYHRDRLVTRKFDACIDVFGADHHGYGPRLKGALQALGLDLGLDAARWFFLEKSLDTHMDFDLDLAKERSQKNPVYYAQYAAVRAANILKKAKFTKEQLDSAKLAGYDAKVPPLGHLKEAEEFELIKQLVRFPETVAQAAAMRRAHELTKYVSELAHAFHLFYERRRVMEDSAETSLDALLVSLARRALVLGTLVVFTRAFGLMGIAVPKKM
ncbi:MAG: Arginine-tRNA ligase [Parcubacteria group bacterium GW2011_GWA1_60_11]|nr:MAG: Arginine-tRNA ligase [Parcubacteria group bacterium GW2011_GWA1_60_11]